MNPQLQITRKTFLQACGAAVATGWLARRVQAEDDVRIQSWELVELPSLPKKLAPILKLTATNGAVGYAKPVAKDIAAAAAAARSANLLEHETLYNRILARGVPRNQVATLDIACWAPHSHLAMAYDDSVFPIAEFPMGEDVPKEYMAGAWLLAPDWPGIYRIQ